MTTLSGKHVLVTGAAGGIGTEVVRLLVDARASLSLVDVEANLLAAVAAGYPHAAIRTEASRLEGIDECRRVVAALASPVSFHRLLRAKIMIAPSPNQTRS